LWDQGGVGNLYVTKRFGTTLSAKEDHVFDSGGDVTEAFWSLDSKRVLFLRAGALWETEHFFRRYPAGEEPGGCEGKTDTSCQPTALNWRSLCTVRLEPIFTCKVSAAAEKIKVAHHDVSINAVNWSPDGKHLVYVGGAKTIRHDEAPEYSGAKIIYTISERIPGGLFVTPSTGWRGGSPYRDRREPPSGWTTATLFLIAYRKTSRREPFISPTITNGSSHVLHEATDAKFWSMPGGAGEGSQASPDGKWICFLSDRDGWDHLT